MRILSKIDINRAYWLNFLRQALEIRQAAEHLHRQAVTLTAVGWAHSREGDQQSALAAYGEALELRRTVGDRQGEAVTLDLQGTAHREAGDQASALTSYRQALELSRDSGDLMNES